MKALLRSFVINTFCLWTVQQFVQGFKISGGFQNLLIIAASLTIVNVFVKPVLKILFIPINIATIGLFSLVINALVFFALDYFFTTLTVTPWTFSGFSYRGFFIPEISFGIIETYFISSLVVSFLSTFFKWL